MTIARRSFIAAALAGLPAAAAAHHGWGWTSGEDVVVRGVIRSVRLGNPHAILEIEDAEGGVWIAELGQPWRHARAGLDEKALVPGAEIVIEGERHPSELRIKAERVVFEGVRYNLYPDRS